MSSSLAVVLTTLLGGRAFAERHGESPAKVVALHGWGRTRADWNATLQGYDALAIDLPGFGATPAPDSGWSTSEYAGWVRRVPRRGGRLRWRPAGARRPLLRRPGRGAARRDEPRAGARDRPDRRTAAAAADRRRPKPALGFRALRFLNKWHFISNDLMEKQRRKRGSADYRAAEGEMREVLVKAVNEDYGDALDALASNRAAGGDGLGRARHRRDDGDGRARPGPGSARTPTWTSCPARRTCSTTALVAALRRAIDDLAARP